MHANREADTICWGSAVYKFRVCSKVHILGSVFPHALYKHSRDSMKSFIERDLQWTISGGVDHTNCSGAGQEKPVEGTLAGMRVNGFASLQSSIQCISCRWRFPSKSSPRHLISLLNVDSFRNNANNPSAQFPEFGQNS